MSKNHLVILKKPWLNAILEGRKTIESRFYMTRKPEFGQVGQGDRLFLKLSSGPVLATAQVGAVKSFEDLTASKISEIRRRYGEFVLGSDEYWRQKSGCRFGFLVWLEGVRLIQPIWITKKDWRGWVVLTEKEDFGLLKASESGKGV